MLVGCNGFFTTTRRSDIEAGIPRVNTGAKVHHRTGVKLHILNLRFAQFATEGGARWGRPLAAPWTTGWVRLVGESTSAPAASSSGARYV
jgi:hypothetical protein